jgi:hypothetical protein
VAKKGNASNRVGDAVELAVGDAVELAVCSCILELAVCSCILG